MKITNIINDVLLEYIYPNGTFQSGKGDFQKAGLKGLELNSSSNNLDDKFLYRNIPGIRYPRDVKNVEFNGEYDKNDEDAKEIVQQIMFTAEKYTDRCLFFNGVVRYVIDNEVTEKDYACLSDICIYLSENPQILKQDIEISNLFKDKDWKNGISNFYGMSFKELKKNFGKDAIKYVKMSKGNALKPSSIITSNNYYVYPCYTFANANAIRQFMHQGMCYTGTDNFFHEHMGDKGVLFLFIRKKRTSNKIVKGTNFLGDERSLDEIGIGISVTNEGEPYLESLTDGNNKSLYNPNDPYIKHGDNFNNTDIEKIRKILGDINGQDVIEYCLLKTKKRQNQKHDGIFQNAIFEYYDNLFKSKHFHDKLIYKNGDLTSYLDNDKIIVLDNIKKIVLIIEKGGFVTINGKEVINANESDKLKDIEKNFIVYVFKNWGGFKHNKRNKGKIIYENRKKVNIRIREENLHKIIKESVLKIINEQKNY